jgi:RNA polymerase sigma factor (sigma-70 family)
VTASEDRSDKQLMLAYAAGEAAAFETLFRRHRRPLYTYLLHHSGSREVADDLFQEVFLRLIRARASYAPTGGFRAWLYVIARHAMTDHHRRTAVRKVVTFESTLDQDHGGASMDGMHAAENRHGDPVAQSQVNALKGCIQAIEPMIDGETLMLLRKLGYVGSER